MRTPTVSTWDNVVGRNRTAYAGHPRRPSDWTPVQARSARAARAEARAQGDRGRGAGPRRARTHRVGLLALWRPRRGLDVQLLCEQADHHGEGGMVLARDGAVAARVRQLANLGFLPGRRFVHEELAPNYRMSSMQAALGSSQAERLRSIAEKKRRIAALYRERLAEVEELGSRRPSPGRSPSTGWSPACSQTPSPVTPRRSRERSGHAASKRVRSSWECTSSHRSALSDISTANGIRSRSASRDVGSICPRGSTSTRRRSTTSSPG